MTQTELFEFKRCSRWSLLCKLVGVFFKRQMTLAWEAEPLTIHEIVKPDGDHVEIHSTPKGLDIRVSHDK